MATVAFARQAAHVPSAFAKRQTVGATVAFAKAAGRCGALRSVEGDGGELVDEVGEGDRVLLHDLVTDAVEHVQP